MILRLSAEVEETSPASDTARQKNMSKRFISRPLR
jgi:hypothetical protein